jgi:hypothetical protein
MKSCSASKGTAKAARFLNFMLLPKLILTPIFP